jgi:hypothetical protein
MLNEDPLVALWFLDSTPGSRALLVFEFEGTPPAVEADATLVGELVANGSLCVETHDGTVLWPTYNPRQPMRAAPRR